jgi:hypothetical protein
MDIIKKYLVTGSLSLLLAVPALAGHQFYEGSYEQEIEARLEWQHFQIEQGYDSQQLTPDEKLLVTNILREILISSVRYQEDGYLTHQEFKGLNQQLDKNSMLIKELFQNNLVRYVTYHDRFAQTETIKRFEP